MHQDTEFYMGMMDDEPEHRLAREMGLTREKRQQIGQILEAARREDASRESIIAAIGAILGSFERDNFEQIMRWSWWQDWPWIECIAIDEASMLTCRCDSCVAVKMRRSHQERQEREFEAMLEQLRERAAKPFYKDWEVPE